MDMFQDWKFYGFCIQAFLTISGFALIKFNDFRHLEKDVREIKNDLKETSSTVIKIDKVTAVHNQRIKELEKSTL